MDVVFIMRAKLQTRISNITSAALVLCAVAVVTITLYVLNVSHWHGPFRDMWEIFPFLQKIIVGSWTMVDLWESYGYSHRLFLPKLLFIADHHFFAATNHLLIIVSIISQILICILFARLLWSADSISTLKKCGLISIPVSLQFSGTLLFNFMHTFDVQWFLCCFFITAAFYQLSCIVLVNTFVNKEKKLTYYFLASGLLITAACLNNFSGMAAWPIWTLLILTRFHGSKSKTILLVTAGLFIAFYAFGIRSAHIDHTGFINGLKYFFYVAVLFPFAYLANPLADMAFLPIGYAAELLVIPALYVLIKFWWSFFKSVVVIENNRIRLFLACIGLFGYGVALMTAIGRGYDPAHVHAMRYQNIVVLFWSAVILLSIFESYHYLVQSRYTLRLPFMVVFAGFIYCQHLAWSQNIWLGYQVNRAHLALMMGYSHDVPMIAPTVSRSMIYVPGYNLERERALYEQSQLGIYHGELAQLWLKGVSVQAITESCKPVSWNLLPYEGSYTRYISFSVTDNTVGYRAAVLADKTGRIIAIAVPEGTFSLVTSILDSLGVYGPPLKGFATSNDKPAVLLLLKDNGSICKTLL